MPRVSRLLALAFRLEELVRAGVVADYATLAELAHVSRARITQVMNLLVLAPDIQEALLFLPRTERGRDPIPLRQLQPLTRIADWGEQRQRWHVLLSNREAAPSRGGLPERAARERWFPRTMRGQEQDPEGRPLSGPDVVRSEKSNPLVNRGTC